MKAEKNQNKSSGLYQYFSRMSVKNWGNSWKKRRAKFLTKIGLSTKDEFGEIHRVGEKSGQM